MFSKGIWSYPNPYLSLAGCQADYQIIQEGYRGAFEKASYKPGNDVDLYLAISKKSIYAKELSLFNETIRRIVEEGKVIEFAEKYYK